MIKWVMVFVVLFVASAALASAQSPQFTLLPNQRTEFRFEYLGDGSAITIAFDSPGAINVTLSIYTPAQLDANARGEIVNPVGRGAPQKNHELFWTGSFNQGGIYRVVLENKSNSVYSYHIDISGDGVKSAAPIMTPAPQPTAEISFDGKQRVLNMPLPQGAGSPSLRLAIPNAPSVCTHANQIAQPIKQSIKLCANETFPPLRISASNIVLVGDDSHTSVITSSGRQFALTIDGSNNWVEDVTIQASADKLDQIAWLCQYDECAFNTPSGKTTVRGGLTYGGGILLNGSNSVIRGVTVRGGMIGIATTNGRRNYILENQLSDVNGWGSFNSKSTESYFVGNEWNRVNHGCTTPDGQKFQHGCETAGWVCLGCSANIIARNQCTASANCYYMSGERGLASNNNKFLSNYCAAATDNCFELTFSRDNVLQDNVSTVDPKSGQACQYPYWVGGSVVYFKNNRWECNIDADKAYEQARGSTTVATNILGLESFVEPPTLPAPAILQNPTSLPTRTAPTLTPLLPTRAAPTPTSTLVRPRNPCVPSQMEMRWDTRYDVMVMPTC